MARVTPPELGRPYVLVTAERERSPCEVPATEIVALYKAHGALLLRGFAADLDAFAAFTAQFCGGAVFNEGAQRQVIDAEHRIQSVSPGTAAFPLHPELSRTPWKPDVAFFLCLDPPSEQGATTLCDGIAIVDALPAEMRAAMQPRRLLYVQRTRPDQLTPWFGTPEPDDAALAAPPVDCPFTFRRDAGGVTRCFTRPLLHRPMFSDRLAFGNFLLFARHGHARRDFPVLDDGSLVPDAWTDLVAILGERMSAAIAWRRGDVLMLDNTRFMHGRTRIVPGDGRRIASYFGYLRFAPPDPEEPADPPWRRGASWPPSAFF